MALGLVCHCLMGLQSWRYSLLVFKEPLKAKRALSWKEH